ncbi:MAG: peptidoglycan-binding domain-containing protein [Woeseiaceae bacterium]
MNKATMKTLAVLAGAAIASGCSSMAADTTSSDAESTSITAADLAASQQRVSELESALAAKERDLANAEARARDDSGSMASMSADASLFPPNPKPGECYARVLIPAKYQTVSEQVLKREAGERIEVIPARYEAGTETVLVKEASTKLEIVPAEYGEVQERVLVKPASSKIVEVPAVYDTVTERVLDKPAHTAWKKGPATVQSANVLSQSLTDTGEIMCLVEVPASYKTVEKRVLVSPARANTIEIPAEYKTVTRTVVKQPATTREVVIPAKYDTVEVTKLVSPASEKRISIPAEYQTVTRTNKATEEMMEWRQVMCEVNMTRDNVLALQKALADKGYYKASVDGVIGGQTLSAARAYAIDKKLPAGSNYVPIEVVKSLDLNL